MTAQRLFMRAAEVAERINKKRSRKTKKTTGRDIHGLIAKGTIPPHDLKRVINEGEKVLLVKATPKNIKAIQAAWKEQQRFKRRIRSTDMSRELKSRGVEISSDDLVWLVKKNLIPGGQKYGRRWFFNPKSVPTIASAIKTLQKNVAKYARYKGE